MVIFKVSGTFRFWAENRHIPNRKFLFMSRDENHMYIPRDSGLFADGYIFLFNNFLWPQAWSLNPLPEVFVYFMRGGRRDSNPSLFSGTFSIEVKHIFFE
jgi:hypothetical protein